MKSTKKRTQLLVTKITEVYSTEWVYMYTVVGSSGIGVQTSEKGVRTSMRELARTLNRKLVRFIN